MTSYWFPLYVDTDHADRVLHFTEQLEAGLNDFNRGVIPTFTTPFGCFVEQPSMGCEAEAISLDEHLPITYALMELPV